MFNSFNSDSYWQEHRKSTPLSLDTKSNFAIIDCSLKRRPNLERCVITCGISLDARARGLRLMSVQRDHPVYLRLKSELVCFEYEPGRAISINALADCLRMSPIPVREALIRLSVEDFVDFMPREGFFPRKPTFAEIKGDIEFLYLAISSFGKQILVMDTNSAGCGCDLSSLRTKDPEAIKDCSTATAESEKFYRNCCAMQENRALARQSLAIVEKTHFIRLICFELLDDVEEFFRGQNDFVDALEAQDANKMSQTLLTNYKRSTDVLEAAFKELAFRLFTKFGAHVA
ncbi:GntR family transcriptional regulator [Pelagibius litoralis]|uniref:GntR family transcriptional regulator n=1 Tax=Pelagibius litoralis TaxID=374515 RepID=A0A967F3T8_9PROT|nr:GntR family transcriptional regulator [Pelagibius litoralis]NIA72321.1 GntR family transcriptional regulator [Pelagibius litoralis]